MKIRIHVLVLMVFVGQPATGHECRHLNDNPADNRLSNLQWGTRQENTDDKHRNGRIHHGEKVYCAKLTDQDATRIRELASEGISFRKLARLYPNVSPAAVRVCAIGHTFRHLSGSVAKRTVYKLTKNDASKIRQMHETGMRQADIAKQFGVCQSHISRIILGMTKHA